MDMLGQGFTLSGAQVVFGSSFMQPPGKLLSALLCHNPQTDMHRRKLCIALQSLSQFIAGMLRT